MSGGDGFAMVGGTQVPLDLGFLGDSGGPGGGDDNALPPPGPACDFCHSGTPCMSPGPDCVIAKKLVGDQFSKVPKPRDPDPEPARGAWVCYGRDGSALDHLCVFDVEIDALRHVVNQRDVTHDMRFLSWGESYC